MESDLPQENESGANAGEEGLSPSDPYSPPPLPEKVTPDVVRALLEQFLQQPSQIPKDEMTARERGLKNIGKAIHTAMASVLLVQKKRATPKAPSTRPPVATTPSVAIPSVPGNTTDYSPAALLTHPLLVRIPDAPREYLPYPADGPLSKADQDKKRRQRNDESKNRSKTYFYEEALLWKPPASEVGAWRDLWAVNDEGQDTGQVENDKSWEYILLQAAKKDPKKTAGLYNAVEAQFDAFVAGLSKALLEHKGRRTYFEDEVDQYGFPLAKPEDYKKQKQGLTEGKLDSMARARSRQYLEDEAVDVMMDAFLKDLVKDLQYDQDGNPKEMTAETKAVMDKLGQWEKEQAAKKAAALAEKEAKEKAEKEAKDKEKSEKAKEARKRKAEAAAAEKEAKKQQTESGGDGEEGEEEATDTKPEQLDAKGDHVEAMDARRPLADNTGSQQNRVAREVARKLREVDALAEISNHIMRESLFDYILYGPWEQWVLKFGNTEWGKFASGWLLELKADLRDVEDPYLTVALWGMYERMKVGGKGKGNNSVGGPYANLYVLLHDGVLCKGILSALYACRPLNIKEDWVKPLRADAPVTREIDDLATRSYLTVPELAESLRAGEDPKMYLAESKNRTTRPGMSRPEDEEAKGYHITAYLKRISRIRSAERARIQSIWESVRPAPFAWASEGMRERILHIWKNAGWNNMQDAAIANFMHQTDIALRDKYDPSTVILFRGGPPLRGGEELIQAVKTQPRFTDYFLRTAYTGQWEGSNMDGTLYGALGPWLQQTAERFASANGLTVDAMRTYLLNRPQARDDEDEEEEEEEEEEPDFANITPRD